MFIQAQLSEFSTKSGEKLPNSITKKHKLPRMFKSAAEAAAIKDVSSAATVSSSSSSFLAIIEAYALKASLN